MKAGETSSLHFWVKAGTGLCLFFAVQIALGWLLQIPLFLQWQRNGASALPLEAILFFLSCCSLYWFYQRKFFLVRWSSSFILAFCLINFAEYVFDLSWSLGNFIPSTFLLEKVSFPGRIAPNSSLAFFIFATTIFFAISLVQRFALLPALSLAGFLVVGVGCASVFGYLADVETGYGWGLATRMSLPVGIGIVVLGITLTLGIWNLYLSYEIRAGALWGTITAYFTMCVLVMVFLASGFSLIPFYNHLYLLEKEKLQRTTELQGEALGVSFLSMESDIRRFYSFPDNTPVKEAVNAIPAIVGFSRFNKEQKKIISFGPVISEKFLDPESSNINSEVQFLGSIDEGGVLYFVLGTYPYLEQGEVRDVFLFEAKPLEESLAAVSEKQKKKLKTYIAIHNVNNTQFFELTKQRLISILAPKNKQFEKQLLTTKSGVPELFEPIITANNPRFVSSFSDDTGKFSILVTTRAENLFRRVNLQLFKYMVGGICLALFGALGAYLLVKSLAEKGEAVERESRDYQMQLEVSLREKEVLLREIHHRVKNNLQVVTSLLRLQEREFSDDTTRDMFAQSQNRVNSIALLHELLYRSENISGVVFESYIKELCDQLVKFYGLKEKIELKVDGGNNRLDFDLAIPCGLIVNELVTNSLKHAFGNQETGRIHVSLKNLKNNKFILTVADNGSGFQGLGDNQQGETLGLRLIQKLVKQIDGQMERVQQQGTAYRISFSIEV